MITWLPQLIYYQFVIVLILAFYTILLLHLRKHQKQRDTRILIHYNELLATALIENLPQSKVLESWKIKKGTSKHLREAMVSQIKMMSGEEKKYLLSLYEAFGYKTLDIRQCKSVFWTKRLDAVIHLGLLESADLAELFSALMKDRAVLVSIAATISLSHLKHPLNSPELLHHLPESILSRSNALFEVVTNLGITHGIDPLTRAIRETNKPKIASACIQALLFIRTLEATDALHSLLKSPQDLTVSTVRQIIRTLGQIGDPASIGFVRPYLGHPSEILIAESALLLILLQDPESLERIKQMKSSSSVEVRRALKMFDAYEQRVANE
ncbi:MAG: HEAT repeat domain-containing protein [Bdellovibrionales bacterium]|nr:HEAT repeat domain-containing protein [Oligoflexia bacterium]